MNKESINTVGIIIGYYVVYFLLLGFVIYSVFFTSSIGLQIVSICLYLGLMIFIIITNRRFRKEMTEEEIVLWKKRQRVKWILLIVILIKFIFKFGVGESLAPNSHKDAMIKMMYVSNKSGHDVTISYIDVKTYGNKEYNIGPEQSVSVARILSASSVPIPNKGGVIMTFDDNVTVSHNNDGDGKYRPIKHNLLDWNAWTKEISQNNMDVISYTYTITLDDYKEACALNENMLLDNENQ